MTDEQLNPDAYEQMYILNIESQLKMSINDIEKFCIQMRQHNVTCQDLSSMINLLNTYDAYFSTYKPIAQRLDKIGKYQLSKRLDEILNDTKITIQIFRQIHQNLLNADKARDKIDK